MSDDNNTQQALVVPTSSSSETTEESIVQQPTLPTVHEGSSPVASSEEKPAGMSSPTTVCVTGGTGFVASHLIFQLLQKGYHVHTTVRSLPKGRDELFQALLNYQKETIPDTVHHFFDEHSLKERVQCFEADLLKEGSFEQAIQGCQFVQHVASPYKVTVENPQHDLVDPAVNGTLNVLKECVKLRETQSNQDQKRLQRIILTSSIAAVVDTAEENKVYDENDWNTLSSLKWNPYSFSKVSAEKAAWKFMKECEEKHGKDFLELVTICPSQVIGRAIMPKQVNQSHEGIMKIANGEFPAIFSLYLPLVDVIDVAAAHVYAMEHEMSDRTRFSPSKAERFIVCCETISMSKVVDILRELYPKESNPWTKRLPNTKLESGFGNALAKVAGLFQPKGVRQYINSSIGKPQNFSTKKIKETFEMKFIDTKDTIRNTVDYLMSIGMIKQ
ncbi:hypothetical protein C9374_007046 [Naegleria lovaniensis]|uniref:NAD-dependent epimerase/dehydratase domain-containing protein n=1 Tax=Naegleria lovaniensis TaxID=51637 RepID=A0AA88GYX8_NAELO|nr:uncharacterized protein C9374_007046 [Naegleria lovaniensis]KAG2393515.1 hypothetical protein C9374_007046 [Naegleria lovaniensis]